MLTPEQIVLHLQTYLPSSTDLFTQFLTVNSGTISEGNILTVNAPSHGLTTSRVVIVKQGDFNVPISSVSLEEDQLTFTIDDGHDQNYPDPAIYGQRFIVFSGFTNVAYNTTHELTGVPNRLNLSINLPNDETEAPTLNGNERLVEVRSAGITGMHQVASVIDTDNFTIEFTGVPEFPNELITGLQIVNRVRVAAAADYERAKEIYTKYPSDENWLFVIMLDVTVSKDRHTLGDADAGFTAQDYNLLNLLQNFATTCFIGTHDELSGGVAQQKAYGEVFEALLKTIYGFTEINQGSAIPYVPIPRGHGPADTAYNSAYYGHAYEWQLPIAIDFSDGFADYAHVAFRDICASWNNNDDIQAQLLSDINLDEDPILALFGAIYAELSLLPDDLSIIDGIIVGDGDTILGTKANDNDILSNDGVNNLELDNALIENSKVVSFWETNPNEKQLSANGLHSPGGIFTGLWENTNSDLRIGQDVNGYIECILFVPDQRYTVEEWDQFTIDGVCSGAPIGNRPGVSLPFNNTDDVNTFLSDQDGSYTGANNFYVKDFEHKLKTITENVVPLYGSRIVTNLFIQNRDISNAIWLKSGGVTVVGTDKFTVDSAGDRVAQRVFTEEDHVYTLSFTASAVINPDISGREYRFVFLGADIGLSALRLTDTPQRYSFTFDGAIGGALTDCGIGDYSPSDHQQVTITDFLLEDVTNQTVQHGSETIDTVSASVTECFGTTKTDILVYDRIRNLITGNFPNGGSAIGDSQLIQSGEFVTVLNAVLPAGVSNEGISGNTLQQIDTRFIADADPANQDFVIIQGGIGNILFATIDPNTAMRASLQSIANKCVSNGAIPLFINISPWGNSTAWNVDRQTWTESYNTWLANFCQTNDYFILDVYASFGETANPEIGSLTKIDTGGLHWHEDGENFVADAFYEYLAQTGISNVSRQAITTPIGFATSPDIENKMLVGDYRDFTMWLASSGAVVTQDEVGVDGIPNAGTNISDNNASGHEFILKDFAIVNDSNWHSFSLMIKKDTITDRFPALFFEFSGGTALEERIIFGTASGNVNESPGAVDGEYAIFDLGNWWFVNVAMQNNSTGNTTARIVVYPAYSSDGSTENNTTTGSIIVDWAQFCNARRCPVHAIEGGETFTQGNLSVSKNNLFPLNN